MANKKGMKSKKWKLSSLEKQVIVLVVILILIFAGFLIAFKISKDIKAKGDHFEYKDFTVYEARLGNVDFYVIPLVIEGGANVDAFFRSDPREVENITLELSKGAFGGISKVWMTTSPDYHSDAVIAQGEVGRVTAAVAISTSYAMTEEIGDFPKITCEDATANTRVIDIRRGNKTQVYSDGDCIIVEGETNNDMIRAADKLAYYWLETLFIQKVDRN